MNIQYAHYFKTLFPLKGVNYLDLKVIGPQNISLMIDSMKYSLAQDYKEEKGLTEFLALAKKKTPVDEFSVSMLEQALNNLSVKIKIHEQAVLSLEEVLSECQDYQKDYPVLPALRNEWYLKKGDDIMFRVRMNSQHYWNPKDKITKRYSWIYGKVHKVGAGIVDVFTHQGLDLPMTSYRGRARDIELESPHLFKREEFLKLRSLIKDKSDDIFLKIFFANSNRKMHNLSYQTLLARLTSPFIEAETEEERQSLEVQLLDYAEHVLRVDLRGGETRIFSL